MGCWCFLEKDDDDGILLVALFIVGIGFSYLLVIPYVLGFLYHYGEALNADTFFTINNFISFVL